MAYCLVCERQRENQDARENKTYVNVAVQARTIGNTDESLAQYQAREPTSVWFDPQNNEFLIEILQTFYQEIIDGTFPLFHDGFGNLPYWQQQNDTTGDALSLGSYDDPEDSGTSFVVDRQLEDTRFVLRVYDKDPVADNTAVSVDSEDFDEDKINTTVERFLRLFQEDGTTGINRNVENDKITVDGRLLDIDWGSSDGLSAGVARIFFSIEFTGTGTFNSDAGYRVLGPTDNQGYTWLVYTKTLNVVVLA